ncbi:hypothetical protein MOR79_001664 [Campylobacter coli]|nr:hypothetical protein [Campylobacter coli]EIY8524448.1 hypothetical protein [Campylobacter coli]ELC8695757.1 hypothetical protein [Campylobacter coli]
MQELGYGVPKKILEYNKVKTAMGDLKKYEVYYYLGNGPLNINIEKYRNNRNEILIFDRIEYKVIMEAYWKINNKSQEENAMMDYRKFYFLNDYSDFVLENENGLLMLHNSWTPEIYKELNIENFLLCKNTLSSIFIKILNLDFRKMYLSIREKIQLKNLEFNLLSFQIKYDTAKSRIQNQLSYKLGQALIQANKTWYKGGYVKMWFEIKNIIHERP